MPCPVELATPAGGWNRGLLEWMGHYAYTFNTTRNLPGARYEVTGAGFAK